MVTMIWLGIYTALNFHAPLQDPTGDVLKVWVCKIQRTYLYFATPLILASLLPPHSPSC